MCTLCFNWKEMDLVYCLLKETGEIWGRQEKWWVDERWILMEWKRVILWVMVTKRGNKMVLELSYTINYQRDILAEKNSTGSYHMLNKKNLTIYTIPKNRRFIKTQYLLLMEKGKSFTRNPNTHQTQTHCSRHLRTCHVVGYHVQWTYLV